MIPKIIHYCWFGGKPYSEKIQKCIDSWKKFLPDFEFKLWNEKTFDIDSSISFVKEAYSKGQFAFVSDYVRFEVLNKFGGIYLDTDVEFIKELDSEILNNQVVLALDDGGYISGSTIMCIKGSFYITDCLNFYKKIHYILENGKFNNEVINTHMQNIMRNYGYKMANIYQEINYKEELIKLYPDEYFHVRSLLTGKFNLTHNSQAIHWHTITWTSKKTKFINLLRIYILIPLLGRKIYSKITKMLKNGKTTL